MSKIRIEPKPDQQKWQYHLEQAIKAYYEKHNTHDLSKMEPSDQLFAQLDSEILFLVRAMYYITNKHKAVLRHSEMPESNVLSVFVTKVLSIQLSGWCVGCFIERLDEFKSETTLGLIRLLKDDLLMEFCDRHEG